MIGWTAERAIEFCKRKGLDHFIFMQRRNTLRQHVSVLLAHASGIWRSPQTPPIHRITIGLDEGFLSQLDYIHQYNTNMLNHIDEGRQRGERWLHLVYEDHIEQSPRVAYEKVCEFLGVEAVEVECRLQNLETHPLSEIIENFDEVREHLSGTRYEAMLQS